MAKRPFTPSEQLVGRKIPKEASYRDLLLAGHLKEDGTPCGRMTPGDTWLTAAHRSLRKSGLIRSSGLVSLMGGRPTNIWHLTEKGLVEARGAVDRVLAARAARRAWSQDFLDARRAAMTAARAPDPQAHPDEDREPDPC
jgi:hypothetical protein